ncbi:MAG: CDP-alcohol phosphatidyltransferase family protein [Verrucomicrobiota bacterium]
MSDPSSRRPLKSRGSAWAGACSRLLLRWKFTPNTVSVLSVVFAALGAVCLYFAPREACAGCQVVLWLGAVLGIQMRLVCNLMDGLLAVEGGLKSAVGDLYNEVPDRIADVLLFTAAGYGAANWHSWAVDAGWAAAAGSVGTAYARALGAGLTGKQDFRGPFAKQHRMAALTLACVAGAAEYALNGSGHTLPVVLAVVAVGTLITSARRLLGTAAVLRSRAS